MQRLAVTDGVPVEKLLKRRRTSAGRQLRSYGLRASTDSRAEIQGWLEGTE